MWINKNVKFLQEEASKLLYGTFTFTNPAALRLEPVTLRRNLHSFYDITDYTDALT